MQNILVIANGAITAKLMDVQVHRYSMVICADGGTRFALEQGMHPDLVVGDLDSLEKKYQDILFAGDYNLDLHPVKKDASDLELALQRAVELKTSTVVIIGGWGSRWDHSLINLHLLARFTTPEITIKMLDADNTARAAVPGKAIRLPGCPGDCISLIPLTPVVKGVRTQGFSYPLDNRDIFFGSSLPVSNSLKDEEGRVSVAAGTLLVIHHYDKFKANYDF